MEVLLFIVIWLLGLIAFVFVYLFYNLLSVCNQLKSEINLLNAEKAIIYAKLSKQESKEIKQTYNRDFLERNNF